MTSYTEFLGDQEYTFRLTPELITELEAKCGAGIGAICNRVFARQFTQDEIGQTIRMALIGGGTSPKRAAEIVAAYVTGRPLIETYDLAAKILERTLFGSPNENLK